MAGWQYLGCDEQVEDVGEVVERHAGEAVEVDGCAFAGGRCNADAPLIACYVEERDYAIAVGVAFSKCVFDDICCGAVIDSEARRCVHGYGLVDDDFEGGAPDWFNDAASTCTTGDYVVGNPTVQSGGGVTTQVGGSNSGTTKVTSRMMVIVASTSRMSG